jgi:hypothetical protein
MFGHWVDSQAKFYNYVIFHYNDYHIRHRGGPQKYLQIYGKRTDFWHLVLLREKVLFEESPPSIMITRNPN